MKVMTISILAVGICAVVLGALAVTVFCHIGALSPSRFYADGQCSATDQPAEVFWSFVILTTIVLTALTALTGLILFGLGKLTGVLKQ